MLIYTCVAPLNIEYESFVRSLAPDWTEWFVAWYKSIWSPIIVYTMEMQSKPADNCKKRIRETAFWEMTSSDWNGLADETSNITQFTHVVFVCWERDDRESCLPFCPSVLPKRSPSSSRVLSLYCRCPVQSSLVFYCYWPTEFIGKIRWFESRTSVCAAGRADQPRCLRRPCGQVFDCRACIVPRLYHFKFLKLPLKLRFCLGVCFAAAICVWFPKITHINALLRNQTPVF